MSTYRNCSGPVTSTAPATQSIQPARLAGTPPEWLPLPAPQCALLSACAARQSRTACVSSSAAAAAALDAARPSDVPAALSQVSLAGACPGGASAGFLQYGADRLSPENRSMCAG